MSAAPKFLFDRTFETAPVVDEPPPEEATEDPGDEEEREFEPPPAFTREDLDRARADGEAAGREHALSEASDAVERRLAETLDTVCNHLEHAKHGADALADSMVRDAVAVALAVARKVIPDLHRRNALGEVEHAVEQVLSGTRDDARLTVRVSGVVRDALAERLAPRLEDRGLDERVTITVDQDLAVGDCRIEWAGGGVIKDTRALWREIDQVVARFAGDAAWLPDGEGTPAPEPASPTPEDPDAEIIEPEAEPA